MTRHFLDLTTTPSVRAARERYQGIRLRDGAPTEKDRLTSAEIEFISARDSFYMASVSETGWPYVQHRGGPPGFLRILDDSTLVFADFRGNRQYVTMGNAAANDRVALFLMDYPNRRRLKLLARLEVLTLEPQSELAEQLAYPDYPGKPERACILHLEAFDWNCPQHITPRFSEAELGPVMEPLRVYIDKLEKENARLIAKLAAKGENT